MAASLIPMEGGSPIALDKPIILIGRHQDCDIPLGTSSKVSRRHCCIVQVAERYVLRDLGSMNGIRINGHRIVETELCPGDEIAIADVYFTFRRDEQVARAGKPGRAIRGVQLPAAALQDESESDLPSLPDVHSLPDVPDGYDPPSDDSGDVRAKDDSHSNEHGFVSV